MNVDRGFLKKKYYPILAVASLLALLFNTNALALVMHGVLDSSFDGDGKVTTPLGTVTSIVIQSDGKIVVAGANYYVGLARFNGDGSLDPSFGEEGKVIADFGDSVGLLAVALQPDGKILVTGGYQGDILLARFNSDGSLDVAFGEGGKVTTIFPSPGAKAMTRGTAFSSYPMERSSLGGLAGPSCLLWSVITRMARSTPPSATRAESRPRQPRFTQVPSPALPCSRMARSWQPALVSAGLA